MLSYPFKFLSSSIRVSINPEYHEADVVNQFCPTDAHRYSTFTNPNKKKEFVYSRAALLQACGAISGLQYEGKKPVIPNAFISLSHCMEGATACHSDELEVGIDIEVERKNIKRISSKFTSQKELEKFQCSAQDAVQFIWGIKESLFKLYGWGGIEFKDDLNIVSFEWDESKKQGWGIAWIHKTCAQRPYQMQCLVQVAKMGKHYICMASHRKKMNPFNSLRTQLREWEPSDASWLYKLNSDSSVTRYTGNAGFLNEESALEIIHSYPNYQRDGYGRWMVIDKASKKPMGWCGLINNNRGIDLGFRFFKEYWGKGVATECASAAIEQAKKMQLHRLIGRAVSQNVGSWRVLEKIGMQRFESAPIEEFASDKNLAPQDLKLWEGQMLFMYKIDL
jgi:RimJ/RimL family protein N-acetyltransferase/phosphopantetheinyl transferase